MLITPATFFKQVGSVVSTTDLVSFWKLDEASGTRYDAFGSNDLTDNNTVGQGTGNVYANAADFVAANAEYLNSASSNFDFVDEMTVCAWIKIDAYSSTGNWIINKRGNTTDGWHLTCINSDGKVYFAVQPDSGAEFITSSSTLSTGSWYFIHGQITGTTFKLGVGGTWENTSTYSGTLSSSSNDLRVGTASWIEDLSLRHDGLIEAVGIWNRALSDAEITALANKNDPFYDQF